MGMAMDIYSPRGFTQARMTPEKCTRKRRRRREKISQRQKGQINNRKCINQIQDDRKDKILQRMNGTSQDNSSHYGKNGYPTLIRKEKKMKRAVKSHRSV